MKVLCTKLVNAITGEPSNRRQWLTIGKIYTVLSISVQSRRDTSFRIIGDNTQTPALFDVEQFRIVSGKIPSNWVASSDEHGALWLEPYKWSRRGFWEDYFNDVPEAIQVFKEEVVVILAEAE